jgi:hypothetical protein
LTTADYYAIALVTVVGGCVLASANERARMLELELLMMRPPADPTPPPPPKAK